MRRKVWGYKKNGHDGKRRNNLKEKFIAGQQTHRLLSGMLDEIIQKPDETEGYKGKEYDPDIPVPEIHP